MQHAQTEYIRVIVQLQKQLLFAVTLTSLLHLFLCGLTLGKKTFAGEKYCVLHKHNVR